MHWMMRDALDAISATEEKLEPRVHGNGFIQIDLSPDHRLHIWGHPDIPRQEYSTPVHNHIFNFTSLVLVGLMINTTFRVTADHENGTHVPWSAQPPLSGHDSKLTRDMVEQRYSVVKSARKVIYPGEGYFFPAMVFHETIVTCPTATLITKAGKTIKDNPTSSVKPTVMVPVGHEPDNEFDRHAHDRDMLMRIVKDVLG